MAGYGRCATLAPLWPWPSLPLLIPPHPASVRSLSLHCSSSKANNPAPGLSHFLSIHSRAVDFFSPPFSLLSLSLSFSLSFPVAVIVEFCARARTAPFSVQFPTNLLASAGALVVFDSGSWRFVVVSWKWFRGIQDRKKLNREFT